MGDRRYTPTRADLNKLLKVTSAPAIAIYMPIFHKGEVSTTISSARLRFKNLSSRAIKLAFDKDASDQAIKKLKHTFAEIYDDLDFWKHRSLGLAVFADSATKKIFDLPITCREYASVDEHFHLAPLMGLMDYMRQYYVLSVARKHPHISLGDMYGLEPSGIVLPESVEAALGIDEWKEKSVQFHSVSGGAGAEWHGQGGAKDRGDQERRLYLKKIDSIVCKKLDKQKPLILAGTDEIAEEYREISHYPNILPGHIPNNHDLGAFIAPSREKILSDVIGKQHAELIAQLQQLQGQAPPRATSNTPALEDAAARGNIKTLLLGLIGYPTATANNKSPELVFPPEEQMTAINRLSLQAWRTSSEIIACEQSQLRPDIAAALLRY